ncbi:MAG: substrate-binding domain-containing protein [Pseudomonadota bacterium]
MKTRGLRRIAGILCLLAGMFATGVRAEARPELLIYCGITLVPPMTEIARLMERELGLDIRISQGASEDLYQSLRKSGVGDLYLPGDPEYRTRHLSEGLLGEFVTVGYNQAALIVRKGNPKKVRADLRELLRDDLAVVIGSPERGAIGVETQHILERAGLYGQVVRAAAALAADSRGLNLMLKRGEADVIINFRATAYFAENAPFMEAIDLPPRTARPQALLLNLTTVSANPAAARRFMRFAAGPQGQAIFRKHGFLDNSTDLEP